jgi:hypothetical protein
VAVSAIIEGILEKALFGDDPNIQQQLLRDVSVIRELVMDMSPRKQEDKDALWQAMTAEADTLFGKNENYRKSDLDSATSLL